MYQNAEDEQHTDGGKPQMESPVAGFHHAHRQDYHVEESDTMVDYDVLHPRRHFRILYGNYPTLTKHTSP